MSEYIQSNDDSGNLALYAGLVTGGLVVGSALAYKASSPKNKSKRGGGGGGLIVPEKGVSYGKGSSQFALGSVAKALTFGKFGGETANKGIKNMVDSIVTDHFNQNADHYKGGLNAMKKTAEAGIQTLGDDAELAKELVGKGQSDKAIINQVLKENPNSMLNEQDLSNIREKKKLGRGEGLSDAEIAQPYIDRQNELKAQAAKIKERKAIEAARIEAANRPKPLVQGPSATGDIADHTPRRRKEMAALSKETADILKHNPNQGVYDVLKQLSPEMAAMPGSSTAVEKIRETAKQRAQKNATSSTPNLQERLAYYKDSKRAHQAHMDSLHAEANLENVSRSHGQLNRSELANLESRQWQVAGATPYKTKTAHRKKDETDAELARRQNAFNQQARRKRFGGAKPESRFKGTKLLKTLL